ncbi:MAG: FAD-dependent oxidoreductase [Spirochaetaceae bacterium]|nr:MAG: FAD-dependent oxidoreductase [Spirochaetaceae bacterium]
MADRYDAVIVGAGIAGLTAARELSSRGRRVIVVDKGRGVGGRIATRRIDGAVFDHGAQFVTARSSEFQGEVERWVQAGVAALWSHGFADGLVGDGSLLTRAADGSDTPHMPARDGHPRYRGVDGMTSIAKHLARGLDVRLSTAVASVTRDANGFEVIDATGSTTAASAVILTPPAPQSIALLDAGAVAVDPDARTTLSAIGYEPCIAVLAFVDDGSAAGAAAGGSIGSGLLPEPGALRRPAPQVEWIADNFAKGSSPHGPALTIHCSPSFSAEHYQSDDATIVDRIASIIRGIGLPALRDAQVKRWRYSAPVAPLSIGAWTDGLPSGLVIAGDAFMGARVEGAFLSGLAAARAVGR